MAATALLLVYAGDAGELSEGRLENEFAHFGLLFLCCLEHIVDLLVFEAFFGDGAYRV